MTIKWEQDLNAFVLDLIWYLRLERIHTSWLLHFLERHFNSWNFTQYPLKSKSLLLGLLAVRCRVLVFGQIWIFLERFIKVRPSLWESVKLSETRGITSDLCALLAASSVFSDTSANIKNETSLEEHYCGGLWDLAFIFNWEGTADDFQIKGSVAWPTIKYDSWQISLGRETVVMMAKPFNYAFTILLLLLLKC